MDNIIDCLKAATPKDGIFEIQHPWFGRVIATANGLEVLGSDKESAEKTEKIVDAMHRRRMDIPNMVYPAGDDELEDVLEKLDPHLIGVPYLTLISGMRGATYKFKFPKGDAIFNLIHGIMDAFIGHRYTGIDQFDQMLKPGASPVPAIPYLATAYINVFDGEANREPNFRKLVGQTDLGPVDIELFGKTPSPKLNKAHLDTSEGRQYADKKQLPHRLNAVFNLFVDYTRSGRAFNGDYTLIPDRQEKPGKSIIIH